MIERKMFTLSRVTCSFDDLTLRISTGLFPFPLAPERPLPRLATSSPARCRSPPERPWRTSAPGQAAALAVDTIENGHNDAYTPRSTDCIRDFPLDVADDRARARSHRRRELSWPIVGAASG